MVRPLSFLSDYGRDDEFVGVVHGVIAKLAPEVKVIDITHGVPAGDVRSGALTLMRAIQYLPDGVALAVVDPGVGTATESDRRRDVMGSLRRAGQRVAVTRRGHRRGGPAGGFDREP